MFLFEEFPFYRVLLNRQICYIVLLMEIRGHHIMGSVVNVLPLPPKLLNCGYEIYGHPLEDLFRFISFHVRT